jgi:protein O-GlcNAc transferase
MLSQPNGDTMAKSKAHSESNPLPRAEIESIFAQGLAFHRAGLLPEAEQIYRRVLQAHPRHFDSVHLLGVIYFQRGEYAAAVRQIDDALQIQTDVADAYNNRGNALKRLGRLEEALTSYNRASALAPKDAASLNNRGSVLKDLKRYKQALTDFDNAIKLKPDFTEAYNNRGNVLLELQRFDEALESYERAIALKSDNADAYNNRGNALNKLNHFDRALASYDRAIALKPNYTEAFTNRAVALTQLQRFAEALASCERALSLKSDHADAYYNRANALKDLQRFEEAIENYDRAIAINPDHAQALCDRGTTLFVLTRVDDALASYERAIALDPNLPRLRGNCLHARMHLCDWTHFQEGYAELLAAIGRGDAACYPFQLLACPSTAQAQLECAKTYVAKRLPNLPAPIWRGERYAHQRIRVAYTSSDFRDHPVAQLTVGLFERHDRTRFETFAVSLGAHMPSRVLERLKASVDRFIDVHGMSDQDVAKRLRELEVDILVDLNGITDGERPYIYAQRPAPVQISYLGYAGTSGPNHCDYILADPFIIPEGDRSCYAEQVVYLPDTFMVTDRTRKIAARTPSRKEAGLPDSGLVFCCFNNSFKITPDVFDVWMRLLGAIEGSVLWLSAANTSAPEHLRREAEQRGVSADRLIFAPRTPLIEDHLARLQLADLFLDTLYYNAHVTACDALWAGVPVLTCAGATYASRVAGSLLSALGLPELTTHSLSEYEAQALRLARHPDELAALRAKLARHRECYPLFDTERFTRHIESAYTTMWERSQRGEQPQSFAVASTSREG